LHLVNWETICSLVPRGPLGIKNLMLFNKALLGKWLLRFRHEGHSLWRQVSIMKYEIHRGGWCSKEAQGPYGGNIRNGWGSFSNFVSYKVGADSRICFWHDVWCGEGALKYSFSEFYSIARNEALVSNYLDLSSSPIHCNPSFSLR